MDTIDNGNSNVDDCEKSLFAGDNFKKCQLFFIGFCVMALQATSQTNNYFGTSGSLNGMDWSTTAMGPYTSVLNTTGGTIINFDNPATISGPGSSTNIRAISVTANVDWTNGTSTLGTGGTIAPIIVANGATLSLSQTISTAAGTGFNKSGAGTLEISVGSAYAGGFILSGGSVIIGGVNALGGNTLELNDGIIASNSTGTSNLTGKFPGGITIGGDIQFGDIIAPALGNANIKFSDPVSLGAGNRVLTLGGAGVISLDGVITGENGISFTKNINGDGIFDITNAGNNITGNININAGKTRFAADGSFGNAANIIVLDGGQLVANTSFSITHDVQLGISAATEINITAGSLTVSGIIADKTSTGIFTKTGTGILEFVNANTYTGTSAITEGTLRLNRTGGTSIPITNNVIVNGGTLRLSTDQTLNDLSILSGNLTLDDGVTFTINGTFDYFKAAAIILGAGSKIVYGPGGTLKYSGSPAKIVQTEEWPLISGPVNVNISNSIGVNLSLSRTIKGNLQLSTGTFGIGAGVLLDLNGASLSSTGGYLAGGATSDFTVEGTSGGIVTIPVASNINFRSVTISGSRTLAMDGIHDMNLSGPLIIDAGATYDSGGESQFINAGGSINISGRFITRNIDGFSGPNTSIPGIIPVLAPGCTIEYGRFGNQNISIRPDYQNLQFTGGGTKTPISAASISPVTGTVTISEATTLDVANNTFGGAAANLNMTGGRLRIGGTGPKPDIDGAYDISGNAVIEFSNSGTVGNETIKGKNGLSNDILYDRIEVTGNKVANSNSNITLNGNGLFTVKPGGVFEINDNSIIAALSTSGQAVVIENNGKFLCGNNQGFNGYASTLTGNSSIHANITNIILATGMPGSTVDYTRAGDQPITNSNGLVYSNLQLSGSGIKIAPAGILTIQGDLINYGAGTFEANEGSVLLNGGVQSFAGLNYNNLLLDNAGVKTLSGDATVLDSLSIGNLISNPPTELELGENYLTVRSTLAKTARVGIVAPAATVSYGLNGRFVIERNYAPRRAWRLITAPITAGVGRSVYSSWQMSGAITPGAGTFVSGPLAPSGGLDISPLNNYSLKTFDGINFRGVDNTTAMPLSGTGGVAGTPDNYGMFIFIRGDRSTTNLFFPPFVNETTLRDTGKIQVKMQTFDLPGPVGGYALVGNPYASPVNMNEVMAAGTGISKTKYYTYDPYLNNDQGGYLTYTADVNGVFTSTPQSPGGQTNILHSSQAFFVQKINNPAALSFYETNKSGATSLGSFRPASSVRSFSANLYVRNMDTSVVLIDGVKAQFDEGYNNSADNIAAVKFTNIRENLALLRNTKKLAVENRRPVVDEDTLFLNLTHIAQKGYQFRFKSENLDPHLTAFLEDAYIATQISISTNRDVVYDFAIDSMEASYAADRFRVVFKMMPVTPTVTTINTTESKIRINPNPVTNNQVHVEFKNMKAGAYHLKLIDNLGRIIFTKTINCPSGTSTETLTPAHELVSGIYQLKVSMPGGKVYRSSVICL